MGTLFQMGWLVLLAFVTPPESVFQSAVRPTDPLTPEAQREAFHLPPGFSITCFASEPDLQKPLNMAFDGRGRLWVTGSVEYPHAAEPGKGRDTIRILEDTDADGRADKVTVFADGLNIPMGLYPYRNGVITYSQPHIWFLQDTDGDDKADRRDILYPDLGTPRDTHGMQNAFRRGFDGWIYVCHGYANDTVVRGRDGSKIELHSGNTYRIRPDGSRVEQFTQGQVNPFGMAVLPNGDWITADCHSKPLTLLIRGGCYPSFGRPHDGLGFVPSLMEHSHGSTAISGVAIPTGDSFPAPYRDTLLVGNVMTSRVHHDRLEYDGATATAIEQPDFIACDDPWFRPVDLQFGPDGALYVADFYNKIIGHYEVDLNHPERDRFRGRIWRIAPTEQAQTARQAVRPHDLTRATIAELVGELASDNLTRRLLATDQLSDRVGRKAVPALQEVLAETDNPWVRVHASWAMMRLDALNRDQLRAAAQAKASVVRVHAMRMLAEWKAWDPDARELVLVGLRDPYAHVRRLAAEAAGLHPDAALVSPLVELLVATPNSDSYLRQTVRIALRNQLRAAPDATIAQLRSLPAREQLAVVEICTTVGHGTVARFLLDVVRNSPAGALPEALIVDCLVHAAEHLPIEHTDAWVDLVRTRLADNLPVQFHVYGAVQDRHLAAQRELPHSVRQWAQELVRQVYPWPSTFGDWVCVSGDNSWNLEPRQQEDGAAETAFLSSLPGGEEKISTLRSPTFTLPEQLSFYLCGHRGFPGTEPLDGNCVRLCLANDGRVVREAFPPRNDIARRVTWDLEEFAGQAAYLELVDGINLSAYAWLAVANFSPPAITLPTPPIVDRSTLTIQALRTIGQLKLVEYVPQLRETIAQAAFDMSTTMEVASAATHSLIAMTTDDAVAGALVDLLDQPRLPLPLRRRLCGALANANVDFDAILQETIASLDFDAQRLVARRLASTAASAQKLATWMEQGRIAPQLLYTESLWQTLRAISNAALLERWDSLRQSAPSPQREVVDRIPRVVEMALSANASADMGKVLYEKHCAVCHKIGDRGNLVGPQLDGIGSRGAMRIAEDVLLPNRNVDQSFRVSVVALQDGRVVTGLKRREEGAQLICVNDKGEEFSIAQKDIEEVQASNTSLMPEGFATTLSDQELAALIAYLAGLVE